MAKEYKIKTVQDMIDCTNEANLDNFLTDLRILLESAHYFRELSQTLSEVVGLPKEITDIKSDGFIWIDDGKRDVDITIGV